MQLGFISVDKCCEVKVQVPLREALENGQINSNNMQGNGLLVILNALLSGITVNRTPKATVPYHIWVEDATTTLSSIIPSGMSLLSFSVANVSNDGGNFNLLTIAGSFEIPDGKSVSFAAEPGEVMDASGIIVNPDPTACKYLLSATFRSA